MRIHRMMSVLCICLLLCVPVCAAGYEEGSLMVTLLNEAGAVPGGSLTLYQLEDDVCGTAQTLAEFAAETGLRGQTRTIGESGVVMFDDLQPGVYLVVQQESAAGYEAILPFLVRIPMEIDGEWICDVQAYPKVAKVSIPDAPHLPQTGQLRWPVPVLAVLGLGLFGFGFHKRKRR